MYIQPPIESRIFYETEFIVYGLDSHSFYTYYTKKKEQSTLKVSLIIDIDILREANQINIPIIELSWENTQG